MRHSSRRIIGNLQFELVQGLLARVSDQFGDDLKLMTTTAEIIFHSVTLEEKMVVICDAILADE